MSAAPLRTPPEPKNSGALRPNPDAAWSVVGPAGLAFATLAAVDLLLIWFPTRLEDEHWAFDAMNAVVGGMPLLAVGLVLGYAAAMARGQRSAVRFFSTIMIGVAAALLAGLGLYFLRFPALLSTAETMEARSGISQAAVRTGLQAALYMTVLLWLGIRGLQDPPSR